MKTLRFDQFEFDNWESEQSLEIAFSPRRGIPHPTVAKFADTILGAGRGEKLPPPKAFSSLATFAADSDYLKRYADITVPNPCNWPCFVIVDDWNERHLILDQGDVFLSVHWSTSA